MVSFNGIDGQNYGKFRWELRQKKTTLASGLFTLKKNRCKVSEVCLQILRACRLF